MIFNGFSKAGTTFLKQLEKNNNKIWFEKNKYIWENEIRTINEHFVQDMGETLQILVPSIKFKPKVGSSLFKIYRDVRFSKDKTPMKDKIGIIFWQGKAHKLQSASFYMHYTKNTYFIATGIRNFKPELLKTYRQYLKHEKHRISLYNILNNLESKGYKISSNKFKKIPKILSHLKDEKYIDLSLHKAMFAYEEFKIDKIFYDITLLDRCFKIYDDMKHLHNWVYEMTLTQ